jgi:tripeptide aminopeptidase
VSTLPKPSRERLTELFLFLTGLPSPSRHERRVADAVTAHLAGLGVTTHEDDTGEAIGGDAGNLWCTVQGVDAEPRVALGAHMDTVEPGDSIEPYLDTEGVFRNRRPAILGADDKAAVAALLHATELLKASGEAFPTYELFFSVSEETGLVGIKHFGEDVLKSPLGVVLDSTGPVGGIVSKAPSMMVLHATFRGRAAHAGVEPERGRSAIQAAGRAIAAMPQGRLDKETSANIGIIHGGVATNIVADLCHIEGECRGHDESRLADVAGQMVDAVQRAAAETNVDVDVDLTHEFRAFSLTTRSPAVRLAKAAVEALGVDPRVTIAGGGSDANVLNARGLPTINLSIGSMHAHSPEEYVALDELERLCGLVLQLIALSPDFAPRPKETVPGS